MASLSFSHRKAILVAAIATCVFLTAHVAPAACHGYLSVPRSRNIVARDRNEGNADAPVNYCPHCLNLGGRRTSDLVYPETAESGRSHGLCGDAPSGPDACWNGGFCPEQDHMPGGRFYTSDGVGGAIQETYVSGSVIEAEFFITAHHRGFIELRLCDEADVTQECLLKYDPLERVRFEDDYTYSAQPIDPAYPGRFFLNPICAFGQEQDRTYSGYHMTGQFKLPEGVTCDHCVIQMWWITANSCVPPNYEEFDFDSRWDNCAGDGGSGFYNEGGSPCLDSTRAEEFWNCADVRITASDGTVPPTSPSPTAPTEAPAPTTAAPTPAPTEPPTCTTQIPVWGQCEGLNNGPWDNKCCEAGTWCRYQNDWYSQCVPGTAPSPNPTTPPPSTPNPTTPPPSSPSPTTPPPSTPNPTTPPPSSPSPTTSPPSTPNPTNAPPSTPEPTTTTCSKIVPTYSQCGGPAVEGENLCCASGDVCVFLNSYYSQCRPDEDIVAPPAAGGTCDVQIPTWGKCGGRDRDYEGTCCKASDECVFHDIYYSQCKPKQSMTRKMLHVH